MNIALNIAQWLLAGVFTLAGGVKLLVPREKLQERMHWAESWPRGRIKLLGLAEVLGAIGLVVPGTTGIAPALTPLAALCLSILMVGAIQTHRRLGEHVLPAVIVGALCLLVAVGHSAPPAQGRPARRLSIERGSETTPGRATTPLR
jgi:uncharacterized membrane protein